MSDDIQQAKTLVLNWQKSTDNAALPDLKTILPAFTTNDYLWRGGASVPRTRRG